MPGYSQDTSLPDSLIYSRTPDTRQFNDAELDEFRTDSDFDYLQQAPGKSLWDRFMNYLNNLWNYLFPDGDESWMEFIFRAIIYIIVTATVVYIAYKLVMMRFSRVVKKQDDSSLQVEISEENIHHLDFDGLVREALENKNYRLAIRLRYLQTLKLLADNKVIAWEPYKTNHEYSYEIQKRETRLAFDRISYYFDYAWYGDFTVDKVHYEKVGELFNQMQEGK